MAILRHNNPNLRHNRGAASEGLTSSPMSFYAALTDSRSIAASVPLLSETFTRATDQWVPDYEGILRRCPSAGHLGVASDAVPGLGGGRLWHNVLNDAQFDDGADYTLTNATIPSSGDDPGGGDHPSEGYAFTEDGTAAAQHSLTDFLNTPAHFDDYGEYLFSMYVKASNRNWIRCLVERKDGTDCYANFDVTNGVPALGTTSNVEGTPSWDVIGSGWYRVYFRFTAGVGGSSSRVILNICDADNSITFNGLTQESLIVSGMMLEKVGGQADKTPSEFLDTDEGPWYEWVSTEHDGSGISDTVLKGVLFESGETNECLHSRDFTDAAWSKTNVTANATSVTCVDGSIRPTCELTATSGNGTVTQAITISSAEFTASFYLRRVTGTGTVELTIDNGGSWTAVAITGTWTRFSVTDTLANPTIGIRIVTSGDEIEADFAQLEAHGGKFTSPIVTDSGTATRNNALLDYNNNDFFDDQQGMIVMTIEPTFTGAGSARVYATPGGVNSAFLATFDTLRGDNNATSLALGTTEGVRQKIGMLWESPGNIQVFVDGTASTAASYDGEFSRNDALFVIGANSAGASGTDAYIRDVFVYSQNFGQSAMEAFTT